jgi:hypothetical protein
MIFMRAADRPDHGGRPERQDRAPQRISDLVVISLGMILAVQKVEMYRVRPQDIKGALVFTVAR